MDTRSVMETRLIGFLLDYCLAAAPASEGGSAVGFLAQYLNSGPERSYRNWKFQYKFLRKLLQLPQSYFQEGSSSTVRLLSLYKMFKYRKYVPGVKTPTYLTYTLLLFAVQM